VCNVVLRVVLGRADVDVEVHFDVGGAEEGRGDVGCEADVVVSCVVSAHAFEGYGHNPKSGNMARKLQKQVKVTSKIKDRRTYRAHVM
jgi:hypothetical protein